LKKRVKTSILTAVLAIFGTACLDTNGVKIPYKKLHDFIWETRFVDVHSHPIAGHMEFDGRSHYPILEPVISRPYFPVDRDRLAVADALEPEALEELYGYTKEEVTASDFPELERLSRNFWQAGKRDSFNRAMDICGIDTVLANLEELGDAFDRARVRWVAFVDSLIYPFDSAAIKSISPFFKQSLQRYYFQGKALAEKFDMSTEDLDSYLRFVDAVLNDCKENDAAALKFASAYIRTLRFDVVEKGEAESIFADGRRTKLTDRKRYKKIQDYIARYICKRAGSLDLPVHFHTGFGYVATLKNLDSNPLNLESIFSDMRFANTRFVMLHAGYPWWDLLEPLLEKKNVFVEFSAANWMIYWDQLADILYRWLSYHGLTGKIMFGSDAGTPVFFWIAAENSRRALYMALSKLIDQKRMSESMAISIAGKIMRENAIRIHNLDR